MLHGGSSPPQNLEAFLQGLRAFGYVEGQHFVIERRSAEGSAERLRDLAAELLQLQIDVMVTAGVAATRAAQQATSTVPIVMITGSDAVVQGFVASLARPGGNITGLAGLSQDLIGKRLELLKETVPRLTRVAALANPASSQDDTQTLPIAARGLGLQLQVWELHRPEELEQTFAAMTREGAEALLVLADPLLIDGLRSHIVTLAAQHRLAAMYSWKMYVEAGGLMSYAYSLPALWERAATYVHKLLHGATPSDLPVERPTKFELVLNLKTAQALGLTVPPTLFILADEVIK